MYITAGVVAGLVLVLFLGKSLFYDFERPGEFEQIVQAVAAQNQRPVNDPQVISTTQRYIDENLTPARVEKFNADALRTLIFLLLAAGALVAFRLKKIPGWTMQALLALLIVIDLGGVGRRYFNELFEYRHTCYYRGSDPGGS